MRKMLLIIHNFASEIFIIFSVTVILISITGFIFGDNIEESASYTITMFKLGNRGLAFSTIFQFLASSAIISLLKLLLLSDKIIKNMMLLWRTVLLVFLVIITVSGFIIFFKWFPINSYIAWLCFLLSFGICFGMGTLTLLIKNKLESKRYEESLANYKLNRNKEDN